ncbi:PTS system mannose/fructose/sorbose family transporter subunit IID [Thermophilibacter mediterraneus]|uniref:PTS system mannose/fructose/sorbose family transporter subunit IID n=1 Tax=Thermophilibacter mediterraneus TaxID=1871031 RepID=UPI0009312C19|nr:PTS system mannose/fructose/sorbose family transporter subunit IID [Thermophilibacter mediterraneus]
MSNETKLTKADLRRAALRWMPMAVNTFSYQYQQAGSVVFALGPALRKIYQSDDEYVEALNNHFNYFNAHPWMANLVLGAALGIEDEGGIAAKEAVQGFKVALMGPMAGIGDSLIWVLYPTIMGSIAGSLALQGNISLTLIWLALNIAFMFVRVWMFEFGYTSGTKLISMLGDRVSMLTETLAILGLVVGGALIPSVVKITTPLTFTAGESVTEIQSILDQIFPFLLPVLATFVCYRLVKGNKVSISVLILIIVVISMVCAAFGILS